jgi:tetratricopeptide (TPR) repeat protein
MAWGAAIEAWKEKPVFGWGHRNFYFAFNKHYNPKFLRHGYGETWFDNAHNIIVNMLATKGIVGTLLYLGIYIAAFFALWLAYRRDQISIHMFALSFAFMIGHLVHNIFVFEDPTSYLYFFFYLAFIDQITRKSSEEKSNNYKDISYGLATATTAVVLIAIYTTNINPTKANMKSLDSLRAMQSANNPVQSVENTLSTPSPHIDAIRGDIAQTALKVIPKYAQSGKTDQARELFNIVYSEIEKNEKLHPRDIRVYFKKARLAQMGASLFNDQQYMKEAEKALETALEHSPKRQQVQFMLANLYVKLGQTDNAEELFKQAVQGDPTIGESWWRLAMFYRQVGNNKKAVETVETAREKGVEFSERGKGAISQIMSATSSKETTSTVES